MSLRTSHNMRVKKQGDIKETASTMHSGLQFNPSDWTVKSLLVFLTLVPYCALAHRLRERECISSWSIGLGLKAWNLYPVSEREHVGAGPEICFT